MIRSGGVGVFEVVDHSPPPAYRYRYPIRRKQMKRQHFITVIGVACLIACHGVAIADDTPLPVKPNAKPLYLHLFATNRAIHHDPWDSRPESKDKWAPIWTCVTTIRVYDNRAFYLRVPSNRDPYVMLDGLVTKLSPNAFQLKLKYELDDSNMTYIEDEKYSTKPDTFVPVADGLYWRLILSSFDDAYDAFDTAEKNDTETKDKDG